jgi:sulfatase maturation enzyme AslB (radical SAM superfamily)
MQTKCLASKHNLFLDSSDRVTLCCNSNEVLDFADGIVDSALVGVRAKEIQLALASDQPHTTCNRCWQEQANGTGSYRESYNDMYPEFELINTTQLKTIHLQNDPTCNLTCVYCGPRFSSSWAGLRGMKDPMLKTLTFSDQALANLSMITLAGGEPGLVKSNVGILDRLLQLNPECQVIINSNLYKIDTPVFERVFKFKNATVIASFETVEDRYNYIRRGSEWNQFSKNFVEAAGRVRKLQASMILFPLSIGTIDQAIDFAQQHVPASEIYINDYDGSLYQWSGMSKDVLNNLKAKLTSYATTADESIKSQLLARLAYIDSLSNVTHFSHLTDFDQLTGQQHRKIFTELY